MKSLNIALKNLKLNNVSFLENISFHFNIGCPLAGKKKKQCLMVHPKPILTQRIAGENWPPTFISSTNRKVYYQEGRFGALFSNS